MFKVNNRNTRHCSGDFVVNFEYICRITTFEPLTEAFPMALQVLQVI